MASLPNNFSVTVYDDTGATVLHKEAFTESQRRGILHMVANAGVEAVWPSAERGLDYDQFEPNTPGPNQGPLVIDDPLVITSRLHPDDSQGHNLGSVGHAKQVLASGATADRAIVPTPKEHAEMVIRTPKLAVSVPPAAPVTAGQVADAGQVNARAKREIARASGYTGDLCSTCGSDRMKRNGSCLCCESCGSTTGCS